MAEERIKRIADGIYKEVGGQEKRGQSHSLYDSCSYGYPRL